jgi:peptide/nickel transport system permease protein
MTDVQVRVNGSRARHFMYIVRDYPLAVAGAVGAALLVLASVAAPLLAPFDPAAQVSAPLLGPGSPGHLLGTDDLGRDVLSRLLYGARTSLGVSVAAVAISLAVGASAGLIAGYKGGAVDALIMRTADVLFAMPSLVLAIVLSAILGANARNAAVAIAVVYMPVFARTARGPALSISKREYVLAARVIGASDTRIMWRHVRHNVTAPIIVQATVLLSTAVLTESALGFVGVGVQPPSPSWGGMLADARAWMIVQPWLAILPGLAIALVVLIFNLLGDGLRDVLDPRLKDAQ